MEGKLAKLEGSRKTLEGCQHEVQEAKEDVLEAEGNLAALEQELAVSRSLLTTELDDVECTLRDSKQEAEKWAKETADAREAANSKPLSATLADDATAILKAAAGSSELILQFVSNVYSGIDNLYDHKKDQNTAKIRAIFAADTTQSFRELASHVQSAADITGVVDKSQTWASEKIEELTRGYKEGLASEDYEKYNQCYNLLDAFKDVKQPPAVHQCREDLFQHVLNTRDAARTCMKEFKIGDVPSDVCEHVADKMAILQEISLNVPCVEDQCEEYLNFLLEEIQSMQRVVGTHKRPTLRQLHTYLHNHTLEAAKLVCRHNLFAAENNKRLNQLTAEFGSDYAVQKCSGSDIDRDSDRESLKKAIDTTLDLHTKLVRDTLVRPTCASLPLEARVRKLAKHAKELIPKHRQMKKGPASWTAAAWQAVFGGETGSLKANCREWCATVHCVAPEVIATIFAVWTILRSSTAFENASKDEEALLTPKASQVLWILRLLGIGSSTDDGCMDSHLAQIRTGEGKSVTLGALATFYALLGYDVDVICYSNFLSMRDYAGFKDIFEIFEVSGCVTYDTFEALADRLGDPGGRIRKVAESACLSRGALPTGADGNVKGTKPKVLFVDEFDQVLNPQLYGQEHRFTTKIKSEKVAELMKHIYTHNLGPSDWDAIQQLPVFVELGNELKRSHLVSAVRNMLQCCSTLDEQPEYVVRDGRIGYFLHDGVNYEMSYGYHTAFAYLKEAGDGKISPDTLKSKLFIPINCGEFSYAEIPNQYLRVYGVSGTLPESTDDRDIVEKSFCIRKRTEVPSIFGENNLKFAAEADTLVEDDESNWHLTIVKEANKAIEAPDGSMRSVILTFETMGALRLFEESPSGGQKWREAGGVKVQTITEETDNKEKNRLIAKAATQGVITLITRALGRGTDFVSEDTKVLANGGVHVLQTHWSIDKSEEIQIMGRTARKGQPGSYSLVLCQKHLERLGFEPEDIKGWREAKQIYNSLREASKKLCAEANSPRVEAVQQCLKRHQETMQTYPVGRANLGAVVTEFLKLRNPSPASVGAMKIVLALDGTSSMHVVISKTKLTIEEMLRRVSVVLEGANASDAAFQIQIVAYRNYNAMQPQELLQVSSWQSKPQLLMDFLKTVTANYGWGDEAVELALAHANRVDADLVVVIGDADAQSLESVMYKRSESTAAPWNQDERFANATHYVPEARRLAEIGCPVSTFFVPTDRRPLKAPPQGFKEISDVTNGTASILNVNDPAGGGEALTEAVCKQILKSLGEKQGVDLVSLYDKATF